MKKVYLLMFFALLIFPATFVIAQDEDAEGCTEYPMFNRMTDFKINSCELKDFEGYKFKISNSREMMLLPKRLKENTTITSTRSKTVKKTKARFIPPFRFSETLKMRLSKARRPSWPRLLKLVIHTVSLLQSM